MRERFGIPKRYVAPETFNVKTLNVKRSWENYSPWKMLFRSHWRTTFGRGNGIRSPARMGAEVRISLCVGHG